MSKIKIQGNATGTGIITLTAPNTSTDRTVTLPDEDITLGGGVDGIVSNADATAITINSSENVGIGDTDPSEAKLSITGVQAGDVGLKIDHDIADTHALQIAADNTTARGIDVECNALTTGHTAKFYSNSSDTSTRQLVRITNDHVNSTGTTLLYADNDSTGLVADFHGAGGVRINSGNLIIGTNGKGIDFSANADSSATGASTNSEVLDDYEEGTWTPTFTNATKTGGITTGLYIRVGRLCHFQYYTGAATFSNTGGSAIIGGLPFTIDSASSAYPVFGYVHGNGVLNCSGWHGDINGTTLYAVQNDSTGYAPFQSGSAKYIMVGGTYIVKEGS